MSIIEDLCRNDFVEVDKREFYTAVRIRKKFKEPKQLELLTHRIVNDYCTAPECLEYKGGDKISSRVGIETRAGMQTDGRIGYLIFGPYKPMTAGSYVLRITGKINSYGEETIVDVTYYKARKIYGRYPRMFASRG